MTVAGRGTPRPPVTVGVAPDLGRRTAAPPDGRWPVCVPVLIGVVFG